MFLLPHQIKDVSQLKHAGHRSLEQDIVDSHESDGLGQYRYLNRPPPQAKQGLQLLNPQIDSGSVFLSETPWTNKYSYLGPGIPNVFSSEDQIKKYISQEEKYIAENKSLQHKKEIGSLANRHLPAYNQPFVSGQSLPAVHSHNNAGHPVYDYRSPWRVDPGEKTNVENYTHIGFRGYPSPYPYATMDERADGFTGYNTDKSLNGHYTQNIRGVENFQYTDKPVQYNDSKFFAFLSIIFVAICLCIFYDTKRY